ncbi:SpdA protein [Streptomyces sp. NPDC001127]|uniref:SpdA protein n=1 Tax=Streptomyces sp. NPDC001127 TaxID=3154377 RepID=UPI00331D5159
MAAKEPMHASDRLGASFEGELTLRLVTGIMAAVVGLTFLFGFGNVWTLALRLGVPPWVAPTVDLSVMGLLLGTRYLALSGAGREQLRPARRLLVFSRVMTLALNVTDPLLAGQIGKAAFDAVGPLLLIGWAEVGPGLLQAISDSGRVKAPASPVQGFPGQGVDRGGPEAEEDATHPSQMAGPPDVDDQRGLPEAVSDDLLDFAREKALDREMALVLRTTDHHVEPTSVLPTAPPGSDPLPQLQYETQPPSGSGATRPGRPARCAAGSPT